MVYTAAGTEKREYCPAYTDKHVQKYREEYDKD